MISIIIPCKNRLKHLKRCIPKLQHQTFKDWECIVVDFNCPNETYKYIESFNHPQIRCIRAKVPEMHWNLSESRNVGYRSSMGTYLAFLDADTLLNSYFLQRTLPLVNDTSFATGITSPPYHATGCMMCSRSAFELVKGYNEELKGWGYEDFDIYERMEAKGHTHNYFDKKLIKTMQHMNAMRNQYHEGRDIDDTNWKNHAIAKKKFKGI